MSAFGRFVAGLIKRPEVIHSGAISLSTTRVYMDVAVDNQPAGRIVLKVCLVWSNILFTLPN